ncbi:phosphatase PAP2 family protein [Streptomyces sp. NPDC002004]
MEARTEPAAAEPDTVTGRPPLVRELLLVLGLFLVYKGGRLLANGHTHEAFHNAHRVWELERAVHLPGEGAVQHVMLHSETVVRLANTYYAAVHFPATLLFLGWLYWRRPHHYIRTRRALAALTSAALVLHLAFPLAPPRMLADAGLVDTGRVYGPTVYGAKPGSDTLANQFAAMPSLHFGWALMLAIGLIAATRSRLRWLWLLHPLLTLLVIVATANHYWLDSIVAAALLGVALWAVGTPRAAASRSRVVRRGGAGAAPGRGRPASAAIPAQSAHGARAGTGAPPGPPTAASRLVPAGTVVRAGTDGVARSGAVVRPGADGVARPDADGLARSGAAR